MPLSDVPEPVPMKREVLPGPLPLPLPSPLPSAPEPPALEEPGLRLAYHACPDILAVSMAGGDAYVRYMSAGVGRIDKLGPRGERVATLDLTLPVPSTQAHARPPKQLRSGRWSPELPLFSLLDLAGQTADDLHLAAAFHIHEESWESRVFRRRGTRWQRISNVDAPTLYSRGTGEMLGFGDDESSGYLAPHFERISGRRRAPSFAPLVEHAARAGAGSGTTAEGIADSGISVLSLDIPPSGPILAVTTYELDLNDGNSASVGTWLMVWKDSSDPALILRITESPADDAQVVGDGAGGGYILVDESLHHWQDETVTAISPPVLDAISSPEEPMSLAGVDPQHRLWIWRGRGVGFLAPTGWKVETLPGTSPILQLPGVQFGTPWAALADHSLWSRRPDGRWVRRPFVEDERHDPSLRAPIDDLVVMAANDPWLIRERLPIEPPPREHGRFMTTSDLYTLRPIERPNSCR